MLQILNAGVQTTVQAGPRIGRRHLGVPWSGAADRLSLALANRLCGNSWDAAALEITMGGFEAIAEQHLTVAVTGAAAEIAVDGEQVTAHRTLRLRRGSVLSIGPARCGFRVYLAVAGGVVAQDVLGSPSTYLPGGFGGHGGRALLQGDPIQTRLVPFAGALATPPDLVPHFGESHVLRVVPSAEHGALTPESRRAVFEGPYRAARQIDRMGIRIEGPTLHVRKGAEQITSSAVHPGTIQLPAAGVPIILGADAQTTGGYPRIFSVIGADIHLLSQIAPGTRIQLFERSFDGAERDAAGLAARTRAWIGEAWLYGGG